MGRPAHTAWPASWEHTFVNEETVDLRDSQGCFLLGQPPGSQGASPTRSVVVTGLLEVGDLSQHSLGAEVDFGRQQSARTCIALGGLLPGPGSGSVCASKLHE